MLSLLPLIFCGIVALLLIGVSGFLLLVKLGVIVRAASQPPHQDYGSYSLSQGREVRPEDDQRV